MIYLFIITFSYAFTIVFDKWTEKNMIFSFYFEWLLKIGTATYDENGNLTSVKWYVKPLGVCNICFNVWITIICFAFLSVFYPLEYIYLLPCIIFCNWLVIKFG